MAISSECEMLKEIQLFLTERRVISWVSASAINGGDGRVF
jgi:hypothetical protein